MEIGLVGTEMLHKDRQRDRQMDMATLIVAYRNFLNTPEKD